ncbi:uncharacterized protein LOC130741304 [Lotus japonicus]|uniref:uncharacterized protein LOC130741304 n=1 Tax=Lotus japonicus TaxID=34305 RepID=UPI002587702A|nr:uncharacterized protein LOC130741304 [Lotus japonicus]
MPQGVVKRCKRILRTFLWGGVEGHRKLAWIKWDVVCKPKKLGGLGIKNWNLFNKALLGKWRWRLLREQNSLRVAVLRAKYKIPSYGEPVERGGKMSAWWNDILRTCFENSSLCWFDSAIKRKLGDGKLERREGRLDTWSWEPEAEGLFTAFIWRVLWGRLQTKENLKRRGIITGDQLVTCVFCNTDEESMKHLLFSCPFAAQVWNTYNRWIGLGAALPHDCWSHFPQHGLLFPNKKQRLGAQTIWLAITWSLWLHRNRVVFREWIKDAGKVFDFTQMRACNWLRVVSKNFCSSLYEWTQL